MYKPPSDPNPRFAPDHPTWRRVLAGYVMLAAIFLSLWVLADPLVRTATLATAAGLLVGARRAAKLAWCVHVCRELTFDLAGAVRITISRIDDPS